MSFENLVNEHGGRVLRTALRVLRDESLAHDVHQDVFLAVWRRWHTYNGTVNWPAYLYRATVRKALEMAQKRGVRSAPASCSPAAPGWESNTTEGGGATCQPEEAMRADELQQKLAAALARLPQRQADAFVLSRLEGLSTAEVSALLGCSEETVRVHLHRAVLRLARELHEYLGQ